MAHYEDVEVWAEVEKMLDTYGAPPGETIEERLRKWEQRERALRLRANDVCAHAISKGVPADFVSVRRELVGALREALNP